MTLVHRLLLNGLAFVLIGLQIPDVVSAVARQRAGTVVGLTVLVCLTVMAVRLLWVFSAAYVPRLLFPTLRKRDPIAPARDLVILGWAGVRGVVTVAAALALPRLTADGVPFPHRDMLVLIAFAVVLSTLVFQGQTLPVLIRWLKVSVGTDDRDRAGAAAWREILSAAVVYLDAALARGDLDGGVEHLRERYDRKLAAALAPSDPGDSEASGDSFGRLHLEVLTEQRRKLTELGARGVVPPEICRRIERELDLEEARVGEMLAGPS